MATVGENMDAGAVFNEFLRYDYGSVKVTARIGRA